jgi:predicted type IV restriction endonuclease
LSISVDKGVSIVTEVKKGWGLTAQDETVRSQAYNYAHESDARYVVITNGDYYGVFDRRKGGSYASQFVGDFQLSLLRSEDNETIQLLRKQHP